MKYNKIFFHGTEGYKAESVPGEEKNQTLPALEEKKGGGGVEAQQDSYCPQLFQTSSVKAHMSCVDLLRTLELSDKLPGKYNQ